MKNTCLASGLAGNTLPRFLSIIRQPLFSLLLITGLSAHADIATMVSPVPGSNFSSSTVTFNWTVGDGGYYLFVGTSQAASDIHNSGYISPGTLTRTVTGVPTTSLIHVRLWSETAPGSGSYHVRYYTYNSDTDSDGILDTIDPNPGTTDPMTTLSGSDHTLTILGSGRMASMESSTLFNTTFDDMSTAETRSITQRVYEHFSDDFDFIIIASKQSSVPSGSYYGRFYNARNDIDGIGKSIFDSTDLFGSLGELQGAIHLTSTGGLSGGPSLHELAHNWGNSMVSVPTVVGGHWGYSNIGGQLGGWEPGSLVDIGGGQYQVNNPRTGVVGGFGGNANGGNGLPYSEFELYTMGLIDANEVSHDIKIANGFSWVDSGAGTFSATSITTTTMAQVVSTDGTRSPDKTTSQKNFRILYLILTDTPLTLAEWADYDADVQAFSLAGSEGTSSYNFWEATGGRASLSMDGLQASLITDEFQITGMTLSSGSPHMAEVMAPSEVGNTYTLEYSTNLISWTDGVSVAGTDAPLTLIHTVGAIRTMYFRVRSE